MLIRNETNKLANFMDKQKDFERTLKDYAKKNEVPLNETNTVSEPPNLAFL